MVLEGGVAVGHGGMASVAGFGEETEVREAEVAHQNQAGLTLLPGLALLGPGVKDHAQEERRLDTDHGHAEGGFSHGTKAPGTALQRVAFTREPSGGWQ